MENRVLLETNPEFKDDIIKWIIISNAKMVEKLELQVSVTIQTAKKLTWKLILSKVAIVIKQTATPRREYRIGHNIMKIQKTMSDCTLLPLMLFPHKQ